jgi:hypothetical protein
MKHEFDMCLEYEYCLTWMLVLRKYPHVVIAREQVRMKYPANY